VLTFSLFDRIETFTQNGFILWSITFFVNLRVATHLENLEKSGNSKVVREKSGKMEKVRETEICLLDFE